MNQARQVKKVITFEDAEDNFTYTIEPITETINITQENGLTFVRYLAQDELVDSPDTWDDNGVFLVNYHRDCWITREDIITRDEAVDYYRKDFEAYGDDGKFPLEEKYHIFPVACLVHSGVWLSLARSFACDAQGWDTSHCGLILVSREESGNDEARARELAQAMINTWNQYLSGDVYVICCQVFDDQWNQKGWECVGGYYGHEYALEELKTFVPDVIEGQDGTYKQIEIQDGN